MKIGVFYASTSGNTEVIADHLIQCLGKDNATRHDIEQSGFSGYENYDLLVFGTPTWDYGNLQSDWESSWDDFLQLDLQDRLVSLFGLGDQYGFSEWYLDAMGAIYEVLVSKGARVIGHWPNEGYEFEQSKALSADGKFFVGLALDEESQALLSQPRLQQWCANLIEEYAQVARVEVDACL